MATKSQIVQDVVNYVAQVGGAYSQWYIGVAADAKDRLFNDHGVTKDGGHWICSPCASSAEARDIDDYFIRQGMKGGPGGGDTTTKFIYAYRITSITRE